MKAYNKSQLPETCPFLGEHFEFSTRINRSHKIMSAHFHWFPGIRQTPPTQVSPKSSLLLCFRWRTTQWRWCWSSWPPSQWCPLSHAGHEFEKLATIPCCASWFDDKKSLSNIPRAKSWLKNQLHFYFCFSPHQFPPHKLKKSRTGRFSWGAGLLETFPPKNGCGM